MVSPSIGDRSPGSSMVYPDWASVVAGTNWQNQQNQQRAAAVPVTSLAGGDSEHPKLMRQAKNAGVESSLSELLGKVNSLNGPQKDTVVRSVKSDALDSRLKSEFHNFDTDRAGTRKTLADFTASYLAADPQAKQLADRDQQAIGEYYDGSYRRGADQLTNDAAIAQAGALSQGIQSAIRGGNVGLLNGLNDSYVSSGITNKAGNLARDSAMWRANQLAGNYERERSGKDRFIGAGSSVLDNYLKRQLTPLSVTQGAEEADLRRLYGIGGAEQANTNYRVSNPQTELAARLGLTGEVSRIDLGNTFYGLGKQNNMSMPGFLSDAATGYGPRNYPQNDGGGGGVGGGGGGGFTKKITTTTNPFQAQRDYDNLPRQESPNPYAVSYEGGAPVGGWPSIFPEQNYWGTPAGGDAPDNTFINPVTGAYDYRPQYWD